MRRVARCQGYHERGRHLRRLVTTPSSTALCSACIIGLNVYGAATYRKLAEQTDDPVVKKNLLALMSVWEEVADSIDDLLMGG
jgi:hypothetical protein